ncbi:hypothetical protein BAUCODRAFT_135482 [Baudoinia panamericana UAMH 10762]|uniref:Uncharacterized protein n=1 Tax=Baudoinia panamericana (strain UAMH 10762) TaxID=717646 RepID=M2MUS1_BAUPA|nr:uncharacterized protein BAUCODRAFT_135482 [Baudoinia panamericana UAMH 10762]EMD00687.1 hypothetical protein BAUCODRAFT_135482 [Baudoinia panamericana UAMH 10762]
MRSKASIIRLTTIHYRTERIEKLCHSLPRPSTTLSFGDLAAHSRNDMMLNVAAVFSFLLLRCCTSAAPVSTFTHHDLGAGPYPIGAPTCGSVNLIFTGLPPYHPLVEAQGFNGSAVNAGLRADAADLISHGYNTRVVLMGPEVDISVLDGRLNDTAWDITGIGYGVRGSNREDLTLRFKDIVQLYHSQAPGAPIVFDHSFTTALWAVQQQLPLIGGNCTNTPGKDLGFEIYCDVCSQ